MKGLSGLSVSFQFLLAAVVAMGMATSDGTSEAVSVASTATARVVEIDASDPLHHRRSRRKLYRSEARLGNDEVGGESFQVNLTLIARTHSPHL